MSKYADMQVQVQALTPEQMSTYEQALAKLRKGKNVDPNEGIRAMRCRLALDAALGVAKAASTPVASPLVAAAKALDAATQQMAEREPADAPKPTASMPGRVFTVTLVIEHEHKRTLWACTDVSAPTIKRACREARSRWASMHKGEGEPVAVAAVSDRDLAKLPLLKRD